MVEFSCTCGAELRFPDADRGLDVECSACRRVVRVPRVGSPEPLRAIARLAWTLTITGVLLCLLHFAGIEELPMGPTPDMDESDRKQAALRILMALKGHALGTAHYAPPGLFGVRWGQALWLQLGLILVLAGVCALVYAYRNATPTRD